MPSFSYDAAGMGRAASQMQDESGYGRAGALRSEQYVESVPVSAGTPLFGKSAAAVQGTGKTLTKLFEDLDRFWYNSSMEVRQTLKRYQSTDRKAAADADEMYKKHAKNPVPEENRP